MIPTTLCICVCGYRRVRGGGCGKVGVCARAPIGAHGGQRSAVGVFFYCSLPFSFQSQGPTDSARLAEQAPRVCLVTPPAQVVQTHTTTPCLAFKWVLAI